jgi:hypothetical protein
MKLEPLLEFIAQTPNWSYFLESQVKWHKIKVCIYLFRRDEGVMKTFEGAGETQDEAAADVWAQINKHIWRHQ